MSQLVSVVIRTLNEAKYLPELLSKIKEQVTPDFSVEVVVVDSGSTDTTIPVAKKFGARVTTIDKTEFTFGRSLNIGCEVARGDVLVFVSGHCVPTDEFWLERLCRPIFEGVAGYTYGRQLGRDTTKFSENQLFLRYFGVASEIPARGFFINNANSAIARKVWKEFRFDENILGLEDMELAKRYTSRGGKTAYSADAGVYHIHDESWAQTFRRYEREAISLKQIMPEIRLTFFDMCRYIAVAIIMDLKAAYTGKVILKEFMPILKFRVAQYRVSYIVNLFHRRMSDKKMVDFFCPKS